jgi:hypothetical protein
VSNERTERRARTTGNDDRPPMPNGIDGAAPCCGRSRVGVVWAVLRALVRLVVAAFHVAGDATSGGDVDPVIRRPHRGKRIPPSNHITVISAVDH